MAQRRPGGGLPVPRVRLPAGDEQRGLARDVEVRHSGARSHRLLAVAGAARPRASLVTSVNTHPRGLSLRLIVTPRNKGDGVPTDQLSHNHCDCTDSHCNSHIVLPFVHLLSQVHRRQKQLSDFVETKKYWTLPKSCGSQSSEWEERKKSRVKRGSLCACRRSCKIVTCRGLRVVEPVYHQASFARQMEEPEEQGKKSRAKRGSLCNLARQSH